MSKRHEISAAEETGVEILTPADEEGIWDDEPHPTPGEHALVLGNPWASAYAVLGDLDTLERFAAGLIDRVRACRDGGRAAGPVLPRAMWTSTAETSGHHARTGERYGERTVTDRAVVLTDPAGDVMVVEGSADGLARWARRLYLNALRAADQAELAALIQELEPRVYDPEPAEGETGTERVVDLYGVVISAVPTRRGLQVQLNTDELLTCRSPLRVEVDDYDVGTWRETGAGDVPAGR